MTFVEPIPFNDIEKFCRYEKQRNGYNELPLFNHEHITQSNQN